MSEYRLTPAARRDLEGIWRYTNQRWGVEQANRYIDVLTEAFAVLAGAPKTAPACDHIRAGYRHRSVERHVVYFKTAPYGIAVVRVLHERMDAPQHL
jgi:toxin ParE1/3/4